ncbi:GNAT family N-acetyltransferase [Streptomyces sp. NRRL S-1448]|uniref:GNAT family N-acetyltransferase n=1 Tax=Streptomyces sp. NRRL S-1448 TaxID=1463883 RepID=UPI002D218F42|nr:GNAT family N-acetyltransferase [Streptomyces sp. NRRL S-1448]
MSSDYVIRQVRVDEWPAVKELRLAALRDPVAPIAFLETYEQAQAQPDKFWKDRTARGAEGDPHECQLVAEGPKGEWAGTVTVLVEEPGAQDFTGELVEQRQAHVVAVFVREEHRGGTMAPALLRAAVGWSLAREGVSRVRLFVHQDNSRAEAFYRRAGFERTRLVGDECEMEYHPVA